MPLPGASQEVKYAGRELTKQEIKQLCHALSMQPITSLCLQDTALTDAKIKLLSEVLMGYRYLEHLSLPDNQLTGRGVSQLLTALAKSPLESLVLGGNPLKDEGIHEICQLSTFRSWSLKVLSLSKTGCTAQGANHLARWLNQSEAKNLQQLYLNANYLRDDGLMVLLPALQKLPNLLSLTLENNRLGPQSMPAFAEWLVQSPKLSQIALAGNPIGIEGIQTLQAIYPQLDNRQALKKTLDNLAYEIYLKQSQACQHQGQWQEALAYCQNALTLQPEALVPLALQETLQTKLRTKQDNIFDITDAMQRLQHLREQLLRLQQKHMPMPPLPAFCLNTLWQGIPLPTENPVLTEQLRHLQTILPNVAVTEISGLLNTWSKQPENLSAKEAAGLLPLVHAIAAIYLQQPETTHLAAAMYYDEAVLALLERVSWVVQQQFYATAARLYAQAIPVIADDQSLTLPFAVRALQLALDQDHVSDQNLIALASQLTAIELLERYRLQRAYLAEAINIWGQGNTALVQQLQIFMTVWGIPLANLQLKTACDDFNRLLSLLLTRYYQQLPAILLMAAETSKEAYAQQLEIIEPLLARLEQQGGFEQALKGYDLLLKYAPRAFNCRLLQEHRSVCHLYHKGQRTPLILPYQQGDWLADRLQVVQLRLAFAEGLQAKQPLLDLQRQYTQGIQTLLAKILTKLISQMSAAPCAWSLLGVGSLVREEPGPYSDMDCAILISEAAYRNHLYFRVFIRQLELALQSLGDLWIWQSGQVTSVGWHIDSENVDDLITPASVGGKLTQQLIQTPQGMAQFVCTESTQDSPSRPHAHALLYPRLLYTSQIPDGSALLPQYQALLNKGLTESLAPTLPSLRHAIAKYSYRTLQQTMTTASNAVFDLKREILAPLAQVCSFIALYFDLRVPVSSTPAILVQLAARSSCDLVQP
jgi:Ran GTPase-activating protein (RanGAP) involved in mRNA processing and transport